MARDVHGNLKWWEPQSPYTITERDDGTLECAVTFDGTRDMLGTGPRVGDSLPVDRRLECYSRQRVFRKNGLASVVCSYFGIDGQETPRIYTMPGGQSTKPIESHPNFEDFGTAENGMKKDKDGLFIGFVDETITEFFGVDFYYTSTVPLTASYWTSRQPKLEKRGTIKPSLPGFKNPPGVEDWLVIDMPFRQVGSFYQVTEQYLGSGDEGWNPEIYGG